METYRREFDPQKRIQLYKEFQEILNDEQPYTFLYVGKRASALQRRFEGVEVFPDGLRPIDWWVPAGAAEIHQRGKRPIIRAIMTSYLTQRLLLMIPTFIGITLIGFLIMRLAPGDPAELRAAGGLGAAGGAGISLEKRGAVDEAMAQWRAQYGLDKPLHVQYLVWLQNLFTLKFGDSFKDSQPVWDKIAETAFGDDQIECLVDSRRLSGRHSAGNLFRDPSPIRRVTKSRRSSPLGFLPCPWCGLRRWRSYLFAAAIFITCFRRAAWSRWISPSSGRCGKKSRIMPGICSCLSFCCPTADSPACPATCGRACWKCSGQDYVQVARAKGLEEKVVIFKHVLRNSLDSPGYAPGRHSSRTDRRQRHH